MVIGLNIFLSYSFALSVDISILLYYTLDVY